MLELALLVGLAGLYVWYLLAVSTLLEKPLAYPREHWGLLVGCPWCSGFWITGTMLAVLHLMGSTDYNVLTHLGAAAVVGVLGADRGV